MGFEQAAIKVEKTQEYSRLQAAIEQAFLPSKVDGFLKQLDRKGIRIRDFVVTLMAAFAALSVLHHWKERARAKLEEDDRR